MIECNANMVRSVQITEQQQITNQGHYTTSIKQPRFGNLSKFLPIVLMKISRPDSDLEPKH